jgi:hypothetical protein
MGANTGLLLDGATAVGYGSNQSPRRKEVSFQGYGQTTSGSGSATIKVWATNIVSPGSADTDWELLGTITLTLSTTRAVDSINSVVPYRWVRGEVDAISGTGAAVSLTVTC